MNTENVHLTAFALCRGARLVRVAISRAKGRCTAVFELEAEDAEAISQEFWDRPIVNLHEYRGHLDRLKDRIADQINRTPTYDPTQRRTHEDLRTRGARAPQGTR